MCMRIRRKKISYKEGCHTGEDTDVWRQYNCTRRKDVCETDCEQMLYIEPVTDRDIKVEKDNTTYSDVSI